MDSVDLEQSIKGGCSQGRSVVKEKEEDFLGFGMVESGGFYFPHACVYG